MTHTSLRTPTQAPRRMLYDPFGPCFRPPLRAEVTDPSIYDLRPEAAPAREPQEPPVPRDPSPSALQGLALMLGLMGGAAIVAIGLATLLGVVGLLVVGADAGPTITSLSSW